MNGEDPRLERYRRQSEEYNRRKLEDAEKLAKGQELFRRFKQFTPAIVERVIPLLEKEMPNLLQYAKDRADSEPTFRLFNPRVREFIVRDTYEMMREFALKLWREEEAKIPDPELRNLVPQWSFGSVAAWTAERAYAVPVPDRCEELRVRFLADLEEAVAEKFEQRRAAQRRPRRDDGK
jgi:hypothetical protein